MNLIKPTKSQLKVLRTIPGYLSLPVEYDDIDELEDYYWEMDLIKEREIEEKELMAEIKKWAREQPEWIEHEKERLKYLTKELKECGDLYLDLYRQGSFLREIVAEKMAQLSKEVKKMSYLTSDSKAKTEINDQMIEKAKEYPLENLLEINQSGFANCIWHDDKNPSMYCKNNFAHCFSCGKSGSVIDVYIELYNCDFKKAVKSLQ